MAKMAGSFSTEHGSVNAFKSLLQCSLPNATKNDLCLFMSQDKSSLRVCVLLFLYSSTALSASGFCASFPCLVIRGCCLLTFWQKTKTKNCEVESKLKKELILH